MRIAACTLKEQRTVVGLSNATTNHLYLRELFCYAEASIMDGNVRLRVSSVRV